MARFHTEDMHYSTLKQSIIVCCQLLGVKVMLNIEMVPKRYMAARADKGTAMISSSSPDRHGFVTGQGIISSLTSFCVRSEIGMHPLRLVIVAEGISGKNQRQSGRVICARVFLLGRKIRETESSSSSESGVLLLHLACCKAAAADGNCPDTAILSEEKEEEEEAFVTAKVVMTVRPGRRRPCSGIVRVCMHSRLMLRTGRALIRWKRELKRASGATLARTWMDAALECWLPGTEVEPLAYAERTEPSSWGIT